jgi:hypothetical protein
MWLWIVLPGALTTFPTKGKLRLHYEDADQLSILQWRNAAHLAHQLSIQNVAKLVQHETAGLFCCDSCFCCLRG